MQNNLTYNLATDSTFRCANSLQTLLAKLNKVALENKLNDYMRIVKKHIAIVSKSEKLCELILDYYCNPWLLRDDNNKLILYRSQFLVEVTNLLPKLPQHLILAEFNCYYNFCTDLANLIFISPPNPLASVCNSAKLNLIPKANTYFFCLYFCQSLAQYDKAERLKLYHFGSLLDQINHSVLARSLPQVLSEFDSQCSLESKINGYKENIKDYKQVSGKIEECYEIAQSLSESSLKSEIMFLIKQLFAKNKLLSTGLSQIENALDSNNLPYSHLNLKSNNPETEKKTFTDLVKIKPKITEISVLSSI